MGNRFLRSFKYAGRGVLSAFRLGSNFKVMIVLALCAVVLGFLFSIAPTEWALIFICIGMVLGAECLNTAIEAVVDLVCPEHHDLAGRAKDCAAGGVLIASIASFVVALFLFVPKFAGLLL